MIVNQDDLLHRLLTKPTVARTASLDRAERSRFSWREDEAGSGYRLTPLGVLHGLFGLTLRVEGR